MWNNELDDDLAGAAALFQQACGQNPTQSSVPNAATQALLGGPMAVTPGCNQRARAVQKDTGEGFRDADCAGRRLQGLDDITSRPSPRSTVRALLHLSGNPFGHKSGHSAQIEISED